MNIDMNLVIVGAIAIAFIVLIVLSKKKKGGGVFVPPQKDKFRSWAKWFYVKALDPSSRTDTYNKKGWGNDIKHIHRGKLDAFFKLCRETGMNTVTLKVAGFDFSGWEPEVRWFMDQTRNYGIDVQISLCDNWHSHKNNVTLAVGDSPDAKYNWWEPVQMEEKLVYIANTMNYFKKWDHILWELGNEMGHGKKSIGDSTVDSKGKAQRFIQHGMPVLNRMLQLSGGRHVGVSEHDIFPNMPVSLAEVHNKHVLSGSGKPWCVNECAGDEDMWRHERIVSDPGAYINWANRVKQHGGIGVCAATWLDLNRGDWNHPNVVKVFKHLGSM